VNERILLVEDEPAIAEVVTFALTSEGFSVDWRSLVSDAETALATVRYDLVVLDVGLPDDSGVELLKRLRRTSELPVIMLTARSAEIDRVVGLELGADDYVTKPFSPRELVARVRAILKRATREARPSKRDPESASRSWFVIDEARATVLYRGHPLELTRYEYLLLKALLAHPEWVYSREKLIQLVWPDASGSLERTVDAHIKAIRAKLRKIEPGCDPIRTHRGLGYSVRVFDTRA
jgi:two-component system, OmpR family, catabolic regulation response regulator CreB